MTHLEELEQQVADAKAQQAKEEQETAEAMKAKAPALPIPPVPPDWTPGVKVSEEATVATVEDKNPAVLIHDPANCKLGRKPHNPSRPRVMLHQILGDVAYPTSFDNTSGLMNWGMDANDTLGICTIAGEEHLVKCWRLMDGEGPDTISDQDVISIYSRDCGYVPGDDSTDQGGNEHDVLRAFQEKGAWGRNIQGFAGVDLKARDRLIWAGENLGAIYIGIALPVTAQSQEVWDLVGVNVQGGEPGSWGGHCVIVVQADADGLIVVTWGALKKMTWAFWDAYVEEAWVCIPDTGDFFTSDGNAPDGLSEATLAKLMAEIGQVLSARVADAEQKPETPAPVHFGSLAERLTALGVEHPEQYLPVHFGSHMWALLQSLFSEVNWDEVRQELVRLLSTPMTLEQREACVTRFISERLPDIKPSVVTWVAHTCLNVVGGHLDTPKAPVATVTPSVAGPGMVNAAVADARGKLS